MPATGNWKHLFSRSLAAQAPRVSFMAHGHHLWPDVTLEAQIAAWHDASALAGRKWDHVLGPVWEEARRHVANELNLPDPGTISFAGNAHDFIVRIVSAMPRRPVRVLTSDSEFLSAMRQLRRWEETGEVTLTIAKPAEIEGIAAKGDFDLIHVSQILYNSGLESDWRSIARLGRPEGPWVVIDGYHGFMALPTDLSGIAERAFYIAGGYKYAMAGEGVGILHAPPGFAPKPGITGWFAQTAEDASQLPGEVWYPKDARRFIGSTFDPSGLYRFNAVRRLLDAEGLDTALMAAHAHALQNRFLQDVRLPGLELVSRFGHEPGARFLAYRGIHAEEVRSKLAEKGVDVDARGDLLRIGFSIYHDEVDLELLIKAAST